MGPTKDQLASYVHFGGKQLVALIVRNNAAITCLATFCLLNLVVFNALLQMLAAVVPVCDGAAPYVEGY